MTTELSEIYDFITLLKLSKGDVGGKYINAPKFIAEFRDSLKEINQSDEVSIDPNLQCFISAANTEYDIPGTTGFGSAFIGMFPGAIIGEVSSIVMVMMLIPADILEEAPIHNIAAFNTVFGAALSGYSFFKLERETKELDIFKDAVLECSEYMHSVEYLGTSSDECEIIG